MCFLLLDKDNAAAVSIYTPSGYSSHVLQSVVNGVTVESEH